MKHLKPSQLAQIGTRLRLKARDLRDDIRRELMQSDDARGREIAGLVGDAGDRSVAHLLADLDAAQVDRDVRELRSVESARERLKAGTYGVCPDCGNAIPWPRLLAQPDAVRCVPCAERHDKAYAHEAVPRL
jgi:RNA polymerase-binding transcription factor DksA